MSSIFGKETAMSGQVIKYLFSILLCAFSLMILSGCITTAEIMKPWIGKSNQELLLSWGAPDGIAEIDDGKKVLTWKTIWSDDYGVHTCRKSFIIDVDGKIKRWSYSGCPAWYLKS